MYVGVHWLHHVFYCASPKCLIPVQASVMICFDHVDLTCENGLQRLAHDFIVSLDRLKHLPSVEGEAMYASQHQLVQGVWVEEKPQRARCTLGCTVL